MYMQYIRAYVTNCFGEHTYFVSSCCDVFMRNGVEKFFVGGVKLPWLRVDLLCVLLYLFGVLVGLVGLVGELFLVNLFVSHQTTYFQHSVSLLCHM